METPTDDAVLDDRKRRILGAVVSDYIDTAEPVGSHVLVQRYSLGVGAATVRYELAEMSDLGYLRQPHTSAGRVPSDRGYRFYVRHLMVPAVLPVSETKRTEAMLRTEQGEVEAILRRTCALLAEMTNLPAVVTPPEHSDTAIVRLFVSPVSADKVLLALVLSTGRTENRIVPDTAIGGIEAVAISDALNERHGGKPVESLLEIDAARESPPVECHCPPALWRRLSAELGRIGLQVTSHRSVYVEAAPAALRQPEFQDATRLGQFLEVLGEQSALREVAATSAADPTRIRIGAELGRPDMADLAFVGSSYHVGMRERGTVGVLGPSRMNYARATTAVRFLADALGKVLSRTAFAG
ncbi:MAG: heat-inducible transcriptional repressor HrcA [Armatimonadota bacterium]